MTSPERLYAEKPAPGTVRLVVAPVIEAVKLAIADVVKAKEDLALGLVDVAEVEAKVEAVKAARVELAATKGVEICKALTAKDLAFEIDGYSIEVANLAPFEHGYQFTVVSAVEIATGKPLPLDDLYRVGNPPVLVPAGTYRQETDALGKLVDVENMAEDAGGAFQRAVLTGVLGYGAAVNGKPAGWTITP